METTEVEGLTVAFERAGHGPPLVLLHGYVGDASSTWRPQIDELCDDFTVIAWDAPGAGGSSDPPETFGMAGYADCLAGFIRRLDLDRPAVAGLSFGGALAIALADRHPDVPAKLVLASAYAGWRGSLPPDVAEQRLQQALLLSEKSPEEFAGTLLPTMFSKRPPQELVEPFRAALLNFHPAGFRAMARASAEDLRHALPHVTVETLLLYGDADVRAPRAVGEHLHTSIAESTLVVWPGVGHVCNLEAVDVFNSAVRDFGHGLPIT